MGQISLLRPGRKSGSLTTRQYVAKSNFNKNDRQKFLIISFLSTNTKPLLHMWSIIYCSSSEEKATKQEEETCKCVSFSLGSKTCKYFHVFFKLFTFFFFILLEYLCFLKCIFRILKFWLNRQKKEFILAKDQVGSLSRGLYAPHSIRTETH